MKIKDSLSTFLTSVYHLGLTNGYRYWQLNRHYSKYPDDLQQFIDVCRQKAILEPYMPWEDFANQCQKSLDKFKKAWLGPIYNLQYQHDKHATIR